uniref:L51_S25_CI-B8 domain-containing protein n=1 Tax=Rhabditophanes sp. KR3021 TaxID=114890 RepID=A0AC35UCE5_9BILA
MSSRVARIYQPGNPQTRVFLADFWMRVVQTPKCGRERLPPNGVKLEVDPRMSRHDVRQYLEKIYKIPVADVRIQNKMGDITWNAPLDKQFRKAVWKDEDKKYAFIFMPKGNSFEYPDMFDENKLDKDLDPIKQEIAKDATNQGYGNRDRGTTGTLLP